MCGALEAARRLAHIPSRPPGRSGELGCGIQRHPSYPLKCPRLLTVSNLAAPQSWGCDVCDATPDTTAAELQQLAMPGIESNTAEEINALAGMRCLVCNGYPPDHPECAGVAFRQLLPDIPRAMWFTFVTVTTVGYGDVTPVTWPGQIFGAFTILCGVVSAPTGTSPSPHSLLVSLLPPPTPSTPPTSSPPPSTGLPRHASQLRGHPLFKRVEGVPAPPAQVQQYAHIAGRRGALDARTPLCYRVTVHPPLLRNPSHLTLRSQCESSS